MEIRNEESVFEESVFDIHTLQFDMLRKSRFKLDFQRLYYYRGDDFITVSEIKKITEYKIHKPFYGLVKSVELFGEDVYKWELCDDTGIIYASAYVNEDTVKVGDGIQLVDCSIWHFSDNHLNIVYDNIKEIYSCKNKS